MREITLEELLEACCHFGHQLTRQNPKARDFVYDVKDGVQIIDLALTKKGLDSAAEFVKKLAQDPESSFLVVGTKRQAAPIVLAETLKARKTLEDKKIKSGIFTVTTRWIGGIFTNFTEVRKNCQKLKDINTLFADEFARSKYTKKELLLMERDKQKLEGFYGGILDMEKLPSAIFIIDTHLEQTSIREASSMKVKTVGIVDTNSDPTLIDYVIPANDDAVGSLQLIISYIIDAWVEGKLNPNKVEEVKENEVKKEVVKEKKEEKKKEEVKEKKAKAATKEEKPAKKEKKK